MKLSIDRVFPHALRSISFLVFMAMTASIHAAELHFDSPQTFYSDREIFIKISSSGLSGKSLQWRLIYTGATVSAGEVIIPDSGIAEIKLSFPKLASGIVATAELACYAEPAKLQKQIFFFSDDDIFSNRKESVGNLGIGVFQPDEKSGNIVKLLETLGVRSSPISSISDYNGKIIIVSGLDFSENPGLFETLLDKCRDGSKVLILAPASGIIPLKDNEISRLLLADTDIIRDYNPKFDDKTWNGKAIFGTSLKTVPLDDGIAIELVPHKTRFQFCEISRKYSPGKIIICGFNLIELADESPSAGYLLKELIER